MQFIHVFGSLTFACSIKARAGKINISKSRALILRAHQPQVMFVAELTSNPNPRFLDGNANILRLANIMCMTMSRDEDVSECNCCAHKWLSHELDEGGTVGGFRRLIIDGEDFYLFSTRLVLLPTSHTVAY